MASNEKGSIAMKKLVTFVALVIALLVAIPSYAQTTYPSVAVGVNAGDHSWVTFYFGHTPDGEPGTTVLIVQCAFNRAELITNYEVYGEQMTSQFFAATCTQSPTTIVNGYPTTTWTLNSTPLVESLVMYPGYWGGPTQSLNLTINGATWTFTGYCGRGHCSGPGATGAAEITY
jgi:hypothetical protein